MSATGEQPPIYTKTGDDGTTGLLFGGRVSKADPVIETCGTLDEAVAALGIGVRLSRTRAFRRSSSSCSEACSPPPRRSPPTREGATGWSRASPRSRLR
jgi:hypothetical protein